MVALLIWLRTQLAPYIKSCPEGTPRIQWSNFPALTVENVSPLNYEGSQAAISTNRTANIAEGQQINLSWEDPGKKVGPNNSYITRRASGDAKYGVLLLFHGDYEAHVYVALLVSMLNATYVPLDNVKSNSASFYFPNNNPIYETDIVPRGENVLNGTDFIVITSDNPYVTPFNLTMVSGFCHLRLQS